MNYPPITHDARVAIYAWNTANLAARREYRRDPFAASKVGSRVCAACKPRPGRRPRCNTCTGRARSLRGGNTTCTCWLDHPAVTR